ncbi:phosphoglycerate kinase [Phenylobacterium sp.]|uniref:phosphoglycerate kinase n=1 Tax=Phenylobacterium sp. TaxID=1871053 RepID=UPI00273094CC|nr:phosphoglycerate kinase [Phenylobacterium sp.]MDP1874426.1 phosphoglycerate kinase [Phenylobacterium sp.]MDP3300271.1 phosphoglycerate kinase [Phenylobacterium sp.]
MTFKTLDDADLKGQRALVRVDINVPMADGQVSDDNRLQAAKPTVDKLRAGGARVILLAHFDRPKGKRVPEMSLAQVVEPLSQVLGVKVAFAEDCIGEAADKAVAALRDGDVLLLENVRFHPGEEKNDADFAQALAANGDLYVNDAFSVAHRAHASTEALAHQLPAYAGEQMRLELQALDAALGKPKRPVLGIVGGAKVSTKLDLLNNLVGKLDALAIGGGMANTFLAAQGVDVGGSLCEHDLGDTAREIMASAETSGCRLLLPVDVATATEVAPGVAAKIQGLDHLGPDDKILDAGPETLARLLAAMDGAATLIWNGPLGVFEVPPFDKATVSAAKHAASLARSGQLVAVAGGGDTVAALNAADCADDFTFVSTAGGAFLEWMEGKTLPGVAALSQ